MATFRIISTRRGSEPQIARFDVELLKGELVAGDSFRCCDTDHNLEFLIRSVVREGGFVFLICHGILRFDHQFEGAVVDTSRTRQGQPSVS
jgi:hypothetical protein